MLHCQGQIVIHTSLDSNRDKIKAEVLLNINKTWQEIAKLVNGKLDTKFRGDSLRKWCEYNQVKKPPQGAGMKGKNFSQDLDSMRGAKETRDNSRKYREALKRIATLEEEIV